MDDSSLDPVLLRALRLSLASCLQASILSERYAGRVRDYAEFTERLSAVIAWHERYAELADAPPGYGIVQDFSADFNRLVACLPPSYKIPPRLAGTPRPSDERILIRGSQREVVIRQYRQCCQYCGGQGTATHGPDGKSWHVDHVLALRVGGAHEWTNWVLSCGYCNVSKGAKALADWRPDVVLQLMAF